MFCDMQGRTPLHIATFENDAEIVKILLRHGASVKTEDHQVPCISKRQT